MATLPTKVVRLKDGSTCVINAADFDPAVHALPSASKSKPKPKPKPSVKKKIAYSSGVKN